MGVMDQSTMLQFLKDNLRVRVSVNVGPEAYENHDRVQVSVSLLLGDDVISEDYHSSALPERS